MKNQNNIDYRDMDPREAEFRRILVHEVNQQRAFERLYKKGLIYIDEQQGLVYFCFDCLATVQNQSAVA